jgi:DNA-binding NtrC family response regulator
MEEEKLSILILDDEPIVVRRLKPALEKMGYQVETFTRSEEALARIEEKDFHIVITDLKMEGVDGMTFLTRVKERSPHTEVIVITGFATMATTRESFQKGVFDFLAKPFKIAEMQQTVQRAAEKIRQGRARQD